MRYFLLLFGISALFPAFAPAQAPGTIITIAGGGSLKGLPGDGGPATQSSLKYPTAATIDATGNLYIADYNDWAYRKMTPDGTITTVAGNGTLVEQPGGGATFIPDGASAVDVSLLPNDVETDAQGNVYLLDGKIGQVLRLNPQGTLTVIAGTYKMPFNPTEDDKDGMPAKDAVLFSADGMAVAADGTIYISENLDNRIYKVTPDGKFYRVAGTGKEVSAGGNTVEGAFEGDGGPATAASLVGPGDLALDGKGNLFVADRRRIRKIDANGIITTVAGNGQDGDWGDGGSALEAAFDVYGLAVGGDGSIYIADGPNGKIRKVDPKGIITTIAGIGGFGFAGDGGPAVQAQFSVPHDVETDANGNLYVVDTQNDRIRKIDTNGIITTIAGGGHAALGDGHLAQDVPVPTGDIHLDAAGNLYLLDYDRVRKIGLDGRITTVAGIGQPGYSGDGGPATEARVMAGGIALDPAGSLYISDVNGNRVRRVGPDGIITPFAGTGNYTNDADGVPALQGGLSLPRSLAFAQGTLYISSYGLIRTVDANGILHTIGGAEGPHDYHLNYGSSFLVEPSGSLLVTLPQEHRVSRISPEGVQTSVAGVGPIGYFDLDSYGGYSGDGGPALDAALNVPSGLAEDGSGNVYIADAGNHRVRRVTPDGIITTIAGTGKSGYSGDGGIATSAQLSVPYSLAVDADGNLLIGDSGNRRIRKVFDPAHLVGTTDGPKDPPVVLGFGRINLQVVTTALRLVVGLQPMTRLQLLAYDAVPDGKLDMKDVTRLLQLAVGDITL